MNLYLALVGFLIIAILWALILFGFFRFKLKIKNKSLVGILFIFIGIGILLFLMGAVVEYTESPEFCGTFCHPQTGLLVKEEPMKPYYDSYTDPGHNSVMETHADNHVTCSKCHDAPGLAGKVTAYVRGIEEIINYITGNYDPDNLGGHVPDENCLKCHDGGVTDKPGAITIEFINSTPFTTDPHEAKEDCVSCHDPHQNGIGLTQETCEICHGTTIDNFSDQLSDHAETTDKDCMVCHNREHPDDARIPYDEMPEVITNDLCADCHQSQIDAYNKWGDDEKGLYGDCASKCHGEHKESAAPHSTILPGYDDCELCHFSGVQTHNPLEISLVNFTEDITNDFCSECHETQAVSYSEWSTTEKALYGDCTSNCHTEHRESNTPHIITAPFKDNCDKCHNDGLANHVLANISYYDFPNEIESDFCESCHKNEYETLQTTIHSSRDCTECHGEHKVTQVLQFDDCSACHSDGKTISGVELNDIPGSHDEDQIGCATASCHKHEYEKIIEVIHSIKSNSN